MCGTGQSPLSSLFEKGKQPTSKKKCSLLKIFGVMFFLGEKEERWRTKKEPSKEKIREGKEEGGGQGKKKSSFLASNGSPVPKFLEVIFWRMGVRGCRMGVRFMCFCV